MNGAKLWARNRAWRLGGSTAAATKQVGRLLATPAPLAPPAIRGRRNSYDCSRHHFHPLPAVYRHTEGILCLSLARTACLRLIRLKVRSRTFLSRSGLQRSLRTIIIHDSSNHISCKQLRSIAAASKSLQSSSPLLMIQRCRPLCLHLTNEFASSVRAEVRQNQVN